MSVPRDQMNVDGLPSDGVGHDVATPEQLAKFDQARGALSRFRVPILVHADNPHEWLYRELCKSMTPCMDRRLHNVFAIAPSHTF